ncbi:hypothetical protein V8C86DRAFT_2875655 [Haematococcus lacustris]
MPCPGELDSVGIQVQQDALHAVGVTRHMLSQACAQLGVQQVHLSTAPHHGVNDAVHIADQLSEVHLTAHDVQCLACLNLEEVQEVGDSGQQDGATDTDGLGQLPLLLSQLRLQQHLSGGQAAIQGRAHLMTHERHELRLGFVCCLLPRHAESALRSLGLCSCQLPLCSDACLSLYQLFAMSSCCLLLAAVYLAPVPLRQV